ncbi:hypothetical protein [Mesobacterium pallidum]|uniref:hypothetical protein n=1 Tax=Mesobacterium pallidum TaxID=2872037 RepID=UPI001EE2F1AF|nr:hypothetical protein [Mesobacterium pallidum]
MSTQIKALGLAGLLTAALSTSALAGDGSLGVDADGGLSVTAGDTTVSTDAGVSTGVTAEDGSLSVDTDVASDTEVDSDMGDATVTADGKASGNASGNMGGSSDRYGQIIAELNTGGDAAADVEQIGEDVMVSTVEIDKLKASGNVTALENAIARNTDGDALRAAVEANAALQTAVEADGYDTDDVLAVRSTADGHVWVIVQGS